VIIRAATIPKHRADRFIDQEADSREGGVSLGDERATCSVSVSAPLGQLMRPRSPSPSRVTQAA
jgi:hypothetical protein